MTNTIGGVGLGLRVDLAEALLDAPAGAVDFVEVHPENYVERGGRFADILERARDRFPVLTHGLTMSFGCPDRFDPDYLRGLRDLVDALEVPFHSDHLCFGGAHGLFVHDLLPIPFDETSVRTAVERLDEAQEALARPVALENLSYYAPQSDDPLAEIDFIAEVLSRSGAKMLLDVNNVFVNAQNLGFDARAWIDRVPAEAVVQYHVAGHLVRGDGLRIDTHGEAICDGVYDLLGHILLERDQNFPALDTLLAEVAELRRIVAEAQSARAAS